MNLQKERGSAVMREDIIKLALDAGLVSANEDQAEIEGDIFEFLDKFASLVAAAEHEKNVPEQFAG